MAKNKGKSNPKPAAIQKAQPFWRWFWGRSFSLIGKNSRLTVVTAGVCYCVWTIADALKVYAGKQYNAAIKFGFDLFADVRFVYTISIAVGTTGVALYIRERNLHRRTRERLAARITELEIVIDPNRRSSKLTPQGLTREDDK